MPIRRCCVVVPVVLLLLLVGACDSGDPIDGPPSASSPVVGTYVFTEFSITPEATVIPALNLLDTLIVSETRLELFPGGEFLLRYRYLGEPASAGPYILLGRYTYSNREVRLQGDPTPSDEKDWRGLLMSDRLTLQRPAGQAEMLTASFRKQVDMGSVSPGYSGLPPLAATIRLGLLRLE